MSQLSELFWRPLPDVRMQERARFLFFAGLATLISFAQTLGLIGTEAIFMAEIGSSGLPLTIIASSVFTVLGSVVYAARVGDTRNDDLYIQMLIGAGAVLVVATLLLPLETAGVSVFLMCFHLLTQAIFFNHLFTFAADYFDTVTSKRLLPLFMIGGSLGSFGGGLVAAIASGLIGPEISIAAWAVFLVVSAGLVRGGRRRLRSWGPIDLEEADESSVEAIKGALRYVRVSPLARALMVSAVGMMLALVIAEYMWLDAFARQYPDPKQLASFMGLYQAATNLIEVAIGMAVTPFLIRTFGVPSANLVHPILTFLSFGGLAYQANIVTGTIARMNGEMLENSLANPIRNLLCNAIPMRFRGRVRAFLEGIVVYAGMSIGGLILLVRSDPDPRWLAAVGGVATVAYLAANWGVRREYLRTLVHELRAGRLDLTHLSDEIGDFEASRLAEMWEMLLRSEGDRPSQSLLKLIPELASRGIVEPLHRAARHAGWEVRRSIVTALADEESRESERVRAAALGDEDARVRLVALRLASSRGGVSEAQRESLMQDSDPRVRAEAARQAGSRGDETLAAMLDSRDADEILAALGNAPPTLLDAASARARDSNPAVRAAALECVARLAHEPPFSLDELRESLRHDDPRVRRATVLVLANSYEEEALEAVASAIDDPASEVQFAAETVLMSYGEDGADAVEPLLGGEIEPSVEIALRVVARSAGERATEVLYRELRGRVRQLWYWVIAYQSVPASDGLASRFLTAALADGIFRNRRIAFRILELLESPAIMQNVEKALRFGSARVRGDALEVLSNLGERESVRLLVILHDAGPLSDRIEVVKKLVPVPESWDDVLTAFLASRSRWVRLGAEALVDAASQSPEEELLMERLLALKQISLFHHLSLEQLEAVHQIAEEIEFLEGEVIMREGEHGDRLHLLLEGRVRVFKRYRELDEEILNEQVAGTYFGEMAVLDGGPRSATIVASERARVLSLDGNSLRELLTQMPEICFEIFKVLANRVREAESKRRPL